MKYTAEFYTGTKIGNNYNYRVGVQIVATEGGKRRYVFRNNTTPCFKTWEGAAHYKSGLNKHDEERQAVAMNLAKKLAKKWNKKGTHK